MFSRHGTRRASLPAAWSVDYAVRVRSLLSLRLLFGDSLTSSLLNIGGVSDGPLNADTLLQVDDVTLRSICP